MYRDRLHAPQHAAIARQIYQFLFPRFAEAPPPCWSPEPDRPTNISEVCTQMGFEDYTQFHRWSTNHRPQFWQHAMSRLGIPLDQAANEVMTGTPEKPQWLPGAKMNIAKACFLAGPQSTAIVTDRGDGSLEAWSYATLQSLSRRVALGLQKLGLKAGDSVAIDMPMNAESVAIYLGIIMMGGAAVSIADSFSSPEIATRLRLGHAKAIFTTDVLLRGNRAFPLYDRVLQADPPLAIVLPAQATLSVTLRDGDLPWDQFLPEMDGFSEISCDPMDTVNILFSSGTTGEPKAIPWNHTTAIKSAVDGHYHQDIQAGNVVAWPTNLGWMMGPWLIFATLVNRGTIALFEGAPNGKPFLKFCERAGVHVLGLVPSLVKSWLAHGDLEGIDLTNLKCFSSTGECSNERDMFMLMASQRFRPVIEYCGGTEIGGGYVSGTLAQPASPATFTTPALGLDFVILSDEGEPADKGEVFLVPPSMGLSVRLLNKDHHQTYFAETPSLDGKVLRRHGDELIRLPGGFYRALGRSDDTMNLGGIKTSSAEIETLLKVIPGVRDAAAVAVAPGGGPSLLVIFAVADGEKASLLTEMQNVIKTKLNPLFKIHDLVLLDQLPRTASGKVMRRVLRDQFESHS